MRIYISSTSEDLEDHRRAVREAIDLYRKDTVVCMERHPAHRRSPVDECRREVATCDLYIGIFAWRYGFVPPANTLSITEIEYREAVRRKIPTLIFLSNEQTPWDARLVDEGDAGVRIRNLRQELQLTKWVRFFSTPDNLAKEVLAAILAFAYEKVRIGTRNESELRRLRARRDAHDDSRRCRRRERIPVAIPAELIRHFQDRECELARLRQSLANEHLRMILLCGRGGVGKTALAVKLIGELAKDNAPAEAAPGEQAFDSIVYVPLDEPGFRSVDRIVEIVSRTLTPKVRQDLSELWNREGHSLRGRLAALFRGPLQRGRRLIVLDNLESVLDDDNRVSPEHAGLQAFMEACLEHDHRTLLLVTSRRAVVLSAAAEIAAIGRRVQVALDDGLPDEHAIALLRGLDVDGRLHVKEAGADVLRQVARGCRGVPRTLETVIATLLQRPTFNLDTLLANPALFARLLADPARELYASLRGDAERLVVQALSIYDHPVPSGAIRYMLPALPVDDLLDRLVRDFVARYDHERFWLHPLDRQHAYSQIPETGAEYSRPALHKLAAEFHQQLRKPPDHWRDINDLEPQLEEFRHLLRAGLRDEACGLLNEIDREHLATWGHSQLIIDLRTPLVGHLVDRGLEGLNLGNLGCAYLEIGDIRSALEHYQRALTAARDTKDRVNEGRWLGNLGLVHEHLGESPDAIALLSQALEVAREIGDRRHEGRWLGNLADVRLRAGQISAADAVHEYRQAIAVSRAEGDLRFVMNWSLALGDVLVGLGEFADAKAPYREALRAAEDIHDRLRAVSLLLKLAAIHEQSGELVERDECRARVHDLVGSMQNLASDPATLARLGGIYAEMGRADEQRRLYADALRAAHDQGDRALERNLLVALGDLHLAAREREQALARYAQAVASARSAAHYSDECTALLRLARVHIAAGQLASATQQYQAARRVAQKAGDRAGEAVVLFEFAEALLNAGRADEASRYYECALEFVAEMHDQASQLVILNRLGMACFVRHDVSCSIGYYQRALTIARELKDRDQESVMLFNIGDAYHFLGEVSRAVPFYEDSLALDSASTNFKCALNLGIAHLQLGQAPAARERFESCLKLVRRALLTQHAFHPWHSSLGIALLGLGRAAEGLAVFRRGLERGPSQEELYYVWQDLRVLERVPGKLEGLSEAIDLFTAALQASANDGI